jgi:D-xylose transport system substrate-binding protein
MKKCLFAFLAIFAAAALAALPKVAVLDISAQKGIDSSVVVPITETIMEEVVGVRAYVVLDRAYVEQVLQEQEFDTSAMVSDTQAAQAGQYLGADYVIAGKVQMLGDTYFLVAKMIEVKTGVIVAQSSTQGEGKVTTLLDMAHSIGKKLVSGSPISPLAPVAGTSSSSSRKLIGLSFADLGYEPWARMRDQMAMILAGAGYEASVRDALHDSRTQIDQIRDLAAQGAKVIIVIAENPRELRPVVEELAAKGVRVIAYDRFIPSPAIAAYVSFDNLEVGRMQARALVDATKGKGGFVLLGGAPNDYNALLFRRGQMEVLQPLVDSKRIKIVADMWVPNWDPREARMLMEKAIADAKVKIDAVLASNDGIALGALDALRAKGLAGKVPVSGQDATEAGCNALARGELVVTIFKDTRKLSPLACDIAIRMDRGEAVPGLVPRPAFDLIGDPGADFPVPCAFIPVVPVAKADLKPLVVDSGWQSYDGVYRGVKSPPPR